jgi:hypothetical protein
MTRNRIVINLENQKDQGSPGRVQTSRKRVWPKVLAVIFVLIVVVIAAAGIGGFLWWRNYQTTTAYSVALIVDAAQRDDMASFQARVNDDEIAKNMIANVSQKAAGRYGVALNASVQKQIDALLPTLVPRLKETIHQEVAKEIKEFASKSKPQPFIVVALAVPRLMTITNDADNATVSASINDRQVELKLRRDNDRWTVTEFNDDVLIQRVVDSMMKELPAIGGLDLKLPIFSTPGKRRNR